MKLAKLSPAILCTTLDLMHAALNLRLANPLPRRCMQVFVVLLRFSADDSKEKLLLPHGRLTGAIKPSVGGLAWTTQSGHDDGGGIRGERFSEGHGQILPQKKKYAMQKINLDKCPQCRQPTRMPNTNQLFRLSDRSEFIGLPLNTVAHWFFRVIDSKSGEKHIRSCDANGEWTSNLTFWVFSDQIKTV